MQLTLVSLGVPKKRWDPAPEIFPLAPRGGLDMSTPIGQAHRRASGPLWPKAGLLRCPRPGARRRTDPPRRAADYAATAGAAAIAARIADEAPLVASCKVLDDTRI